MTKEDCSEKILAFCEYFRKLLKSIMLIKDANKETTYLLQRMACVCALDALSKCVAEPGVNNKQRFTVFIKYFCDWKDSNRVSIPHLVKLLKCNPSPALEELRCFANREFKRRAAANIMPINSEPTWDDVIKIAKRPRTSTCDNDGRAFSVESVSHCSLMSQF